MGGGEIPHYDVNQLPIVDDKVFRPEDLPTEREAEQLDAALVSRAVVYLNEHPEDARVKRAYDSYREAVNDVNTQNQIAEDNLTLELGMMERHNELNSKVIGLSAEVDKLVKAMDDIQKSVDALRKKIEKDPESQKGLLSSIIIYQDSYDRKYNEASDLIANVRAIEGMSDDVDLMDSIDRIQAKVKKMRSVDGLEEADIKDVEELPVAQKEENVDGEREKNEDSSGSESADGLAVVDIPRSDDGTVHVDDLPVFKEGEAVGESGEKTV